MGRLWRKQRKLQAKLGEYGDKPKNMRWRTHERIHLQIAEVEKRKDAAFCLDAMRFLRGRGVLMHRI